MESHFLTESAVRNLQKYLRQLAYFHPEIPLVPIDGIYGSETQYAVREFQKEYDLPVTGVVDSKTWDAIYDEYQKSVRLHAKPLPLDLFPHTQASYTLKPGDTGYLVEAVQFVLDELSLYYPYIEFIQRTGVFDEETQHAIQVFQRHEGLPQTGAVDLETWNALTRMYNETFRAENN